MSSTLEIIQQVEQEAAHPQEQPADSTDLYDLSRDDLAALLKERLDLPPFRATQIFEWVYQRRVTNFEAMTNIAKPVREQLTGLFTIPQPKIRTLQESVDGSRKYLFEIDRGQFVESVMICQERRWTLCVSSQVGCGMGCAFCRTGEMGFHRNLRTAEIIGQVVGVLDDSLRRGHDFNNIVFMGMGEPLHNYRGVVTALKILKDGHGLNFSGRKVTVSSVGLVPAIERFSTSGVDVSLAISLNATTDEVRSKIMPVNRRFPLERLLATLRSFPLKPRQRITIEYVMLAGVNDSAADLQRLPKLLNGIPVKINLIPYNENAGLGFKSPSEQWVREWQDLLTRRGYNTTIRWSKGRDIDAACGQLAVQIQKAA